MVVPLAEVAQRLRRGVSQMLFETERELLMLIMITHGEYFRDCAPCRRGSRKVGAYTITA